MPKSSAGRPRKQLPTTSSGSAKSPLPQAYTGTQNRFSETGAQSLDLSVSQQTTNSLRSVLGAQIGGSIDLGWREKLALQLRVGWSHEYASTARPVTATLSGAPLMPFTTYGVAPQRDGAVVGFSANTAIAEATSLYLRYEGTSLARTVPTR
jgi:outer membrane autotransporter protein